MKSFFLFFLVSSLLIGSLTSCQRFSSTQERDYSDYYQSKPIAFRDRDYFHSDPIR